MIRLRGLVVTVLSSRSVRRLRENSKSAPWGVLENAVAAGGVVARVAGPEHARRRTCRRGARKRRSSPRTCKNSVRFDQLKPPSYPPALAHTAAQTVPSRSAPAGRVQLMFQKKASWWKEFDWVEGVPPHPREDETRSVSTGGRDETCPVSREGGGGCVSEAHSGAGDRRHVRAAGGRGGRARRAWRA